MIDLIKKSMLAGIGAAVVTRDAAEKSLNELVEKGKISTEEARKMADKIVDEGRREYDKTRDEFSKFTEELLQKGNLVTRSQWAALEARVAVLEEAATASATRKAASKKTADSKN